jgi:hypothetical protein
MAMNPRALGALSALVLFFACAAGSEPASPQESQVPAQIQIIEAEPLRGFLAQGGCVAVGKVLRVELFNQGTRGSRLRIHVEVEKQLEGSLPRQLSFLTWGGPADTKAGQQLLFAARPPPPQAQDALLQSFFVIPAGKGEEAVQKQQEVLTKVKQAR